MARSIRLTVVVMILMAIIFGLSLWVGSILLERGNRADLSSAKNPRGAWSTNEPAEFPTGSILELELPGPAGIKEIEKEVTEELGKQGTEAIGDVVEAIKIADRYVKSREWG